MLILLSRTQARPGRALKQEQEQNSRNQVQAFLIVSVIRGVTIVDAQSLVVAAEPQKRNGIKRDHRNVCVNCKL